MLDQHARKLILTGRWQYFKNQSYRPFIKSSKRKVPALNLSLVSGNTSSTQLQDLHLPPQGPPALPVHVICLLTMHKREVQTSHPARWTCPPLLSSFHALNKVTVTQVEAACSVWVVPAVHHLVILSVSQALQRIVLMLGITVL